MWGEVFFFFGTPIVLGVIGVFLKWEIGGVDNILAAFAILTGLLFNLLVLLFDVAEKAAQGADGISQSNVRLKLAKQLQANVTYSLLIGLVVTSILGVSAGMDIEKINRWISGLLVILLANFTLTLLMIMRRIRAAFLASFV
ncbi:hypothetical protein [Streptomyces sp. NRRL S-1868]|uniref:hypothetical protein n=1 Tax=Streptomyces sp. NRRL S-1868 TaxID=1463892 RepID=UPI00131B75C3|nr:hypothetical protein [Streptomyces sp. NRRL S-1868]